MAKRYALSKKTAQRILGTADRVEKTPVQRKTLYRNPRLRGGGSVTRTWAKVITGLAYGDAGVGGVSAYTVHKCSEDGTVTDATDITISTPKGGKVSATTDMRIYAPWYKVGNIVEIVQVDSTWYINDDQQYLGETGAASMRIDEDTLQLEAVWS